MYPTEIIPDTDKLYRRVHKNNVDNGELKPIVFSETHGGMSTDWEKYCTPDQARLLAKIPNDNGIISLNSGRTKSFGLKIIHTPTNTRRSHTDVSGIDIENRLLLLDIFNWEINI